MGEARPVGRSHEHGELLTEDEVFQRQVATTPARRGSRFEQRADEAEHEARVAERGRERKDPADGVYERHSLSRVSED